MEPNNDQLNTGVATTNGSTTVRTAAQEKAKGAKDRELLFEVTQAVLAVVVVLGGGAMLFVDSGNPNATFIGGAVGTVLALYFQKKVNGKE